MLVTINGTDFSSATKVEIGGALCSPVTVLSATQVTCITAASSAGVSNVKVYINDQISGTGSNLFTYKSPPIVNTVTPSSGALAGGTTITLSGSGFESNSIVKIGSFNCLGVNVLSSTSLTCITPVNSPGIVSVNVIDQYNFTRIKSNAFTYQVAPIVTSVSPSESGLGGGRSITITGTGFLPGAAATVGGNPCANALVFDANTLVCDNPISLTSGLKPVTVTNADNQSGTKIYGFKYNLTPVITTVYPEVGTPTGNTAITITGSNFNTGAILKIDGSVCSNAVLVNSTTMTCTTSAHAAGSVNVSITNTDTGVGTLTNGFTFQNSPTITSVTPPAGSLSGGTTLTINGTGFSAGATVVVGGVNCGSVTKVSSAQITCVTGARAAGLVSMTVTNADSQARTFSNAYTYQPGPTLSSISPVEGLRTGGTALTLTGTNFLSGATVSIGGTACASVVVVNATTITCNSPVHSGGAKDVVVTNTDTQISTLTNGYFYFYVLSGTLTYDSVPTGTNGLNFENTTQKPVRNVIVELIEDSGGTVVDSLSSSDTGSYSFVIPSSVTNVHLRVWAAMTTPDYKIVDNTNSQAEYAYVSNSVTMNIDTVKNINMSSGWTGTNSAGSYTGTRYAAPFSIIDTLYSTVKKIKDVRPAITFPPLKVNWSVNNTNVYGDRTIGQVGWKFYDPAVDEIFILGADGVDTDEYDTHILVHEWGHYFENHLSKSNSMGGSHSLGESKDIGLSFGEGWGNALSAIVLDPDPLYVDSMGLRSQGGFNINIATVSDPSKGWFSEVSVMQILYYLYDSNVRTGDNLSLGLGPIVDVLTGYQKTTPALTSIFSFIYGLKQSLPAQAANIDTLLATKNISSVTDPYGSSETHNGGWSYNLPIHNSLTMGGSSVAVKLVGNVTGDPSLTAVNSIFNARLFYTTATTTSTQINVSTSDSFQMMVYVNGVNTYYQSEDRTTAAPIGPFAYTFTTVPGDIILIRVTCDGTKIFDSSVYVDLSVGVMAL
jgi:hypothetical protein